MGKFGCRKKFAKDTDVDDEDEDEDDDDEDQIFKLNLGHLYLATNQFIQAIYRNFVFLHKVVQPKKQ